MTRRIRHYKMIVPVTSRIGGWAYTEHYLVLWAKWTKPVGFTKLIRAIELGSPIKP
jgi:hypothetical protein